MKRLVAGLVLVVFPLLGFGLPAGALGLGACTITGTMTFSATSEAGGTWKIAPAVIDCQGIIAARRRITGRGMFMGSGTYREVVGGSGACLHHAGTGTLDYRIPTSGGELVISEPGTYTVAGAGLLATPTLEGTFALPPPYKGDCVSQPVTTAGFTAGVRLYRYPRELPVPSAPAPQVVPGAPHGAHWSPTDAKEIA